MSREKSKYPSTYYRVSLKAIIKNDAGKVLLTKEGGAWFFPGGGLEHDESDTEALKRELQEEALIDTAFTMRPLGVEPVYVEHHDVWLLWIFYEVQLPEGFSYGTGDVDATAFHDPEDFRDSDNSWERSMYKWAKKISAD